MKTKTPLILAALAAAALASAQRPAKRDSGREAPQWVRPPISAENLHHQTFDSPAAGTAVSYLVYLPPGYEKARDERFPVVYWLHGIGGSQEGVPNFCARFTEAIVAGKCPPMLVVFVNGMMDSFYCDAINAPRPVESCIIKDLIPHIDATYRTVATRAGRMVEGFSMGGFGAGHLGFKYPELFGSVSIIDGALVDIGSMGQRHGELFERIFDGKEDIFLAAHPNTLAEQNAAQIKGRTPIRLAVGKLADANRALHEQLTRLGIVHDYDLFPDAGHSAGTIYDRLGDRNWDFYRRAFDATAPSPARKEAAAERRALPALSWEQLLRLDANGDGRIGRDEFRGPPKLFDRLDRNGDGGVSKDEHEAALEFLASRQRPEAGAGRMASLRPTPTHANAAYGPDGRNVLDFWQAESDRPAPLAVFIHGGGFVGGSKDQLNPRELSELLDAGISVAAINYRLLAQAPLPAAQQDAARALQFLRSKAAEWNIDKTRIGGFGGSAGAQLVMYLAFHDDLADPASTDPVARESSRLACVAPTGGQITMDMNWWDAHVPGYAERGQQRRTIQEMFGTGDEAKAMATIQDIAALALISRGDPPVFMSYAMAPGDEAPSGEREQGWMIHHVVHGLELKKLCDRFGVEAHLNYPGAQPRYASATEFFKAKLLAEAPRADAAGAPRWTTGAVQAPRLQYRTFKSAAADAPVSYHIYTPEAYDAEANRLFPVLYWLHGSGGGPAGVAQLARYFDDAIRAGTIPPMLVVFPNGLPMGMWCNSKDGRTPVETIVIQELLPHIDATFRTIAAREGRIIEGFSMGGYGAARLGFNYPALFSAVSLLGAGPLQPDFTETPRVGPQGRDQVLAAIYGGDLDYFRAQSPWRMAEQNAAALKKGLRVRQVIGERDETFAFNRQFHDHLAALGIPHAFTVLPGIGHDPMAVLQTLGEANGEFYRSVFGRNP